MQYAGGTVRQRQRTPLSSFMLYHPSDRPDFILVLHSVAALFRTEISVWAVIVLNVFLAIYTV